MFKIHDLYNTQNHEIPFDNTFDYFLMYESFTFILFSIYFGVNYMNTNLSLINKILSISTIILYNNIEYYFNNFTLKQYNIITKVTWLFTSPTIIYVVSSISNENFSNNILVDLFLQGFNVFQVVTCNQYNDTQLYIIMYIMYIYNIFDFYCKNTIFKYTLILSWLLIGFQESLYILGYIDLQMRLKYTIISDIFIKCFIFSLYALICGITNSIKKNITLKDFELLNYLYYNVNSYNNFMFQNTKVFIKQLIEDDTLINNSKINMSELIYSKHLTQNFYKKIVSKSGIQVDSIFIIFSDIVKYSELCINDDTSNIFNLLNRLYNAYDEALKHSKYLQKIESIGDCYFVTSLLDKNLLKNVKISEILNDVLNLCEKIIEIANSNKLNIRIGVHIGNVSVGIIGTEIPRLAVVGSNVNLASRLESTCSINKIHVSKEVHKLIKECNIKKINIRSNNKIPLKNMGTYDTFTIVL